jgi:transposase-like protein
MMGSMDFWIIGSSVTLVAQGVWNPVLLPSCFPYGHSGPCEKPSKNGLAPKRWTDEVTFREKIMKQLKSQRRHSKAFRKEAVELLLTGRTLGELAEQLQVPVATLHNWKQEYLMDLEHQAPDVAGLPPLKMQEEIQRLRKENQKLKLHQEILKKALGILSDVPPSGMP